MSINFEGIIFNSGSAVFSIILLLW